MADTRTALAFPGQGTQRTGMARDFHDASAAARDVFRAPSDALHLDVAALCFEPDPRLELTEFAQPAIVAAEIAMLAALRSELGVEASAYGGHSLGEYSALVAAGVLDVGAAVTLVRERGRFMQEAVPVGEGSMVAVVQPGLDLAALVAGLTGSGIDIANVNSADQVVLSGRKSDVDEAAKRVRGIAGFERARCLPLKVSAPFHSHWMQPAAERLRPLLVASSTSWRAAGATAVTCNLSGAMHDADASRIVERLAGQVTAPVRWLDNMRALAARADRVIELGPGKPLRAFFASIGVEAVSVTTWEAARAISPAA
jgi:[acyl-carrier-protein] S-malonyltransferase/trans-AT polyketide synthase/acyltransferase/oxidoreductase domain-containing protein